MSSSLPAKWLGDAEAGRAHSVRHLQWYIDKGLYWVPIATATFFSKFAVPPLGAAGISIAIPAMLAMVCIALVFQRLVLEPKVAAAYLFVLGSLFAMQSMADSRYSLLSLILLALLHLPYVFRMVQPPSYIRVIRFVQAVGLTVAVLGIFQYTLQFVVSARFVFPLENFVPDSFIVSLFNQQAPVAYGATIYRANGMVMVEPSVFSQLMAICILIELISKRRWWYFAIALLAMVMSYSGTGMLLLVATLVVFAVERGKIGLVTVVFAGAFLLAALGSVFQDIPILGHMISRLGEFSSTGSSGFARFVGGYYMFDEFLWPSPVRTLIGYGAGTFKFYMAAATYPVSEMAIFKVVFEFGLLGAVLYFGLLVYCFGRSSAPLVLKVGLAICLILSGNYFPFAHALAFVLLVWTESDQRIRRLPGAV
ncbi:MAG TPA: hypothetical protein VM469_12865 [Pseudoxanthomonas sp.]|nr:hypothetical protein [Pseudoxanthomonas sp.]